MRQFDLFTEARSRSRVPQSPDPDAIQVRLGEVLEHLRAVDRMPWAPSQLRSWQQVFHNMANWLPPAERDSLRRDFAAEVARLLQDQSQT